MSALLAYPVALGAALVTTLAMVALSVVHTRVVGKEPVEAVLLSMIFLYVSLIFLASAFASIVGVAVGQLVALAAPTAAPWVTVALAGVLVWFACAWSQHRLGGLTQGPQPLPVGPVLTLCALNMTILAGGLSLVPASPRF